MAKYWARLHAGVSFGAHHREHLAPLAPPHTRRMPTLTTTAPRNEEFATRRLASSSLRTLFLLIVCTANSEDRARIHTYTTRRHLQDTGRSRLESVWTGLELNGGGSGASSGGFLPFWAIFGPFWGHFGPFWAGKPLENPRFQGRMAGLLPRWCGNGPIMGLKSIGVALDPFGAD